MVGAGVLGLPYAMSELVWGPGAVVLILSWVITLYTLWQMIEMHEMFEGQHFDRYHELGQAAFGRKLGLYIIVPLQLLVETSACIIYMVTGCESLKKFVLSLLKNFNSISSVSLVAAVMSVSYSTIAWVASLARDVPDNVEYGYKKRTNSVPLDFRCIGAMAFAYTFKSLLSFSYDKEIAPHEGSKPFICFTGKGFENVPELKHRGEVVDNLNLTGLDRAYICSAISPTKVFLTHCAIKLKKSGTIVPRIELVEVGPSMDLVIRRNRLPNEGLRKEAMKSSKDKPKKKLKNVDQDDVHGKTGRIYIPEQKVGETPLPDKSKGVKRERREGKLKKNNEEGSASKKQKESE